MKKILCILITICLIAGLLPVFASAAGGTAKVEIISSDTGTSSPLEISEGQVRYMVTDNGLAREMGASATNYNIKFEWAAGGTPTLYLKSANLKATGDSARAIYFAGGTATDMAIVVEEDSEIQAKGGATKQAIAVWVDKKNLTVSGDAKLTLTLENASGIYMNQTGISTGVATYDLTLDHANLDITADNTNGKGTCAVGNHVRNLTIDGGTYTAKSVGLSVFYTWGNGDEMILTGNAKFDISVQDKSAFYAYSKFTMENGQVKTRLGNAIWSKEAVTISGGTIDHDGGQFINGAAPDLSGYTDEHSIVISNETGGKNAQMFDPEKVDSQKTWRYWQITSGVSYEVSVKNGTTDSGVAKEGDTVTITARVAPAGKAFDKWEVNEGTITLKDPTATSTTFTMPAETVKVTALFKTVEEEDEPDTPAEESTPEESTPEESLPHVSLPDASTPDESTPDASTPDSNNENNTNEGGNKKPAVKNNDWIYYVIMAVLVLGTGGAIAGILLYRKKQAEPAAEAEEITEDAEAPAEDAE